MTEVSTAGGPDMIFQQYLADGRFMIQRGVKTGTHVFFPRAVAPGTGEELEWVDATGRGTVFSCTVVRKRPPAPSISIALIDLEEGVRMLARIEDVDADAVKIGMAVQAKIIPHEEQHLVVFTPAEGTAA